MNIIRQIFKNFHNSHPWIFNISCGLIVALLTYGYHYFSNSFALKESELSSSTDQNIQQEKHNAEQPKNASRIITTITTRKVTIGGNNTESLVGSDNIGNIFLDVQNVIISGKNNKDIVIKDSNSIKLSGKNNVIYVVNCKEININGNDNKVYVVEGSIKRKIDGSRNVIKQITTEDFRKLNLL